MDEKTTTEEWFGASSGGAMPFLASALDPSVLESMGTTSGNNPRVIGLQVPSNFLELLNEAQQLSKMFASMHTTIEIMCVEAFMDNLDINDAMTELKKKLTSHSCNEDGSPCGCQQFFTMLYDSVYNTIDLTEKRSNIYKEFMNRISFAMRTIFEKNMPKRMMENGTMVAI